MLNAIHTTQRAFRLKLLDVKPRDFYVVGDQMLPDYAALADNPQTRDTLLGEIVRERVAWLNKKGPAKGETREQFERRKTSEKTRFDYFTSINFSTGE